MPVRYVAAAVEDFPWERARATFETNFSGGVRMTRLVLPSMRAQGAPRSTRRRRTRI